MWVFWICALIPIAIGAVLLWRNHQVVWWEWLIGTVVALLTAGIMQMIALAGQTTDFESVSGEIVKVAHHPEWVEEYEQSHTRQVASGTDANGNTTYTTETYYTTEHDTHEEHWVAHRSFGGWEDTRDIEYETYRQIKKSFGGRIVDGGKQDTDHFGGEYDSGDNNIYETPNDKGVVYPVTATKVFENRVKAAPTIFSFAPVPTNVTVHPWPDNPDWMNSDRVLGTAKGLISTYEWDVMNSLLGPRKRVNVIIVGFGDKPSDYGHYQQAKWIGGKKNDLVITFGGGGKSQPAQWAYVFGWTESDLVKRNLETLFVQKPINDKIIPFVIDEVTKNYIIKDWSKFDYISIDPPTWSYWAYFIVMIITQSVLWVFFHNNREDKDSRGSGGYGYGYSFPRYRGYNKWNI
jgi:hypothetical protein